MPKGFCRASVSGNTHPDDSYENQLQSIQTMGEALLADATACPTTKNSKPE